MDPMDRREPTVSKEMEVDNKEEMETGSRFHRTLKTRGKGSTLLFNLSEGLTLRRNLSIK